MEIKYPYIVICSILIFIFIFVKKINFRKHDKNIRNIANTKYIEQSKIYKQIVKKYKVIKNSTFILYFLIVVITSFLAARIINIETYNDNAGFRDIMICMDVSTSVCKLNMEIINELKEVVGQLDGGDRVGITIFNTSSTLAVPLTDDYTYILETMDILAQSFEMNLDFYADYDDELLYIKNYIFSGTLYNNLYRGSSLIGEGLATSVYNFPNLEDTSRSRALIFTTDNELAGEEIVSLNQAAQIVKDNNINLYVIAPDFTTQNNLEGLKESVSIAEGMLYLETENQTSTKIVSEIEKLEKQVGQEKAMKIEIDNPQIPFILVSLIFLGLIFLSMKGKI